MAARKRNNPLDAVAKRFGVTAREARDIATAVANAASVSYSRAGNAPLKVPAKRLAKDVVRQVKETGRAAVTGKKGTTALKTYDMTDKAAKRTYSSSKKNREQLDVPKGIKKGTKRK